MRVMIECHIYFFPLSRWVKVDIVRQLILIVWGVCVGVDGDGGWQVGFWFMICETLPQ